MDVLKTVSTTRTNSFFASAARIACVFIATMATGAGIAHAELRLDPPEVLVDRARESRVAYLGVLNEIDKSIPEMRIREEVDLYLDILDDLERIGKEQDRNNMGSTVFDGVATRLSRHALRWVRYELDTEEQVLSPHRYADPDAALDLVIEHRSDLSNIVDVTERMRLVANVSALQRFATTIGWPRKVVAGYVALRSDVALAELVQLEKMKENEFGFWLGHLSPGAGYDMFLRSLHERVLTYPQPDPTRFHLYALVLGKMRAQIDQNMKETPAYVLTLLGDVSRDLISAHFYQEVFFTGNDFEMLLSNLNRSQLQHFVYMINDPSFTVSSAYKTHFLQKGSLMVARLNELGMLREADLLRRRLDQIRASR